MAVCLLDSRGSGFRCSRRAEDLVTEEIEGCQDDAQDEDEDVGGYRKCHGKRKELPRGRRREMGRFLDNDTSRV